MKIISKFLAVMAVITLSVAPTQLHAQDAPPPPPDDQSQGDQGAPDDQSDQGASFQNFYDQLGSQGSWVQTDDYGYVFQPAVTDPNWAPYTDGHWAYTDDGWAWVSNEPWGWATYHYGRWVNIDGAGWVWVPGYRWAPAWVSWRYGGGYCGWAPLPPETFLGAEYASGGVSIGIGFRFGSDVDVNFNIGPGCYNFVPIGYMGDPNYRGHYLDRSRNFTVINHTTNITNINIYNNGTTGAAAHFRGVTTGGPSLAQVNAQAHNRIPTYRLAASNQPGQSTVQGNSLAVYAPRVNPATLHTARPAQVAQTIAHPSFNRGDSITKPLEVNSSLKPTPPSTEAIAAAKQARASAPASARIATAKTQIKTPITTPLTSMQPVHHTTTATTPGVNNANTAKPEVEHSTAASPYTGEPDAKPTTTYHPSTESSSYTGESSPKPAATYHPPTETSPYTGESSPKPATTYHSEAAPTEEKPTYHPETEAKPTEEKPEATYHPQSEPTHEAPAPTYHPQSEPTHEAPPAPAFHPQATAPVSHPSPPASVPHPAATGKPAGPTNKPQG